MTLPPEERLRRWRLLLGAADQADGTGCALTKDDQHLDAALGALYDRSGSGDSPGSKRPAGLGGSSPHVMRWLGDIRRFFPKSVVQVMQKDAMDRLDLKRLLLEPEMLENVEPDVHLVGTLLSLNSVIPEKTRATAREVVRRVVEQLERRLASPLQQAITGSLNRSARNRRPRHDEIDWPRTIRAQQRFQQWRALPPEQRRALRQRYQQFKVCRRSSSSTCASPFNGFVRCRRSSAASYGSNGDR